MTPAVPWILKNFATVGVRRDMTTIGSPDATEDQTVTEHSTTSTETASPTHDIEGLTDAELVNRFAALEGAVSEYAFTALVQRHGPMVLRVCQAHLRDGHSAHDAFQATFMILMRKAHSLQVRDTLAPWLHEVAYRVSSSAQASQARRTRHERRAAEMAERQITEKAPDDAAPLLHKEVSLLPERYRRPVILCYLEGLSGEQAAVQLGIPVGTVRSRLARGRERLRSRLVRHGVVLSAPLLGASLVSGGPPTTLPIGLAETTIQTAMLAANGGEVPATVEAMVQEEGNVPRPSIRKLKAAIGGLLILGVILASAAAWFFPPRRVAPTSPRVRVAAKAPVRSASRAAPAAPVWNIALSPGGKRLLAGVQGENGQPHELILWDLASRQEIFRVVEPRASRSVAFSPDGQIIATGGFGPVARLFDAATGGVLLPLRGHSSGINTVVFSPDGKTLATGSWDETAKLWDVATGKARATLKGHTAPIFGLAYSPDGKSVATGSRDSTVRIWDSCCGAPMTTLIGHEGVVEFVTYSPDAKTLATASWDGTLRLWDVATGHELAKLDVPLEDTPCKPQLAIAFSPDGKMLASLSGPAEGAHETLGCVLKLWSLPDQKQLVSIPAHADRSYSVLFTPDGKTLITSSMDRTIKLWDVATGQNRATLTTASDGKTKATAKVISKTQKLTGRQTQLPMPRL